MKNVKEPPIAYSARQLLFEVEVCVKKFPRYYKYTLGTELRQNAMKIMQCIQRAQSRKRKRRVLQQLSEVIDDVKNSDIARQTIGMPHQ